MPTIVEYLTLHCALTGAVLVFFALMLASLRLIGWLRFGAWVWAASLLYFFVHPFATLVSGDVSYYALRVEAMGGPPLILHGTAVICAGLTAFFVAYCFTRERARAPQLGFKPGWPPGALAIASVSILAATLSVLLYRVSGSPSLEGRGNTFTGEVTGYQVVANLLANYPIILLLAFRKTRKPAIIVMTIFIGVRALYDPWGRTSVVALLLAASMILGMHRFRSAESDGMGTGTPALGRRTRTLPRWPWMVLPALLAVFLIARGHNTAEEAREIGAFQQHRTIVDRVTLSGETAMLGGLYFSMYVADEGGYTYGLPLIRKVLFGPLPRRWFPWKDDVFSDWLPDYRPPSSLSRKYVGAKGSIIGSFYRYGGMIAVIICMAAMGYGCRLGDATVRPEVPIAVRAAGVTVLSWVWMAIGSSASWCVMAIGFMLAPFIGLWIYNHLWHGDDSRRSSVRAPGHHHPGTTIMR